MRVCECGCAYVVWHMVMVPTEARALEPQDLELQVVVSHRRGWKGQTSAQLQKKGHQLYATLTSATSTASKEWNVYNWPNLHEEFSPEHLASGLRPDNLILQDTQTSHLENGGSPVSP